MNIMLNPTPTSRSWATAIWNRVLELDSVIIGIFICVMAAYEWFAFYDGIGRIMPYYSQGFYWLSLLIILSALGPTIYLTFAGIILVSSGQPLSRYKTVLPNLLAVLAAFTPYMFVWMPKGSLFRVNAYVALSFIVLGITIIILSLSFLRRAFSVTPQAKVLVTGGPYSLIRHPMYVGNILSLFGMALLIDSAEAMGLFFICGSLQVGRALYEEKLLQNNFHEYADYQNRVGCFVPRLLSYARKLVTV